MDNNLNIDLSNLLKQVNSVVEKEVNNILKDYSDNYKLYEETYTAVMKAVNHSSNVNLSSSSEIKVEPKVSDENINLKDIISCIKCTLQEEIKPIHHELNNLKTSYEEQNNKISLLSNEILDIKNLNQFVNDLKVELASLKDEISELKKPVLQLSSESVNKESCTDCDYFIQKGIKENITLKIEEEEEEEVKEEVKEEIKEEVKEEVKEDVKEEEEEEEYFEIEIDDITYYTNNEENGIIYEVTKDEEVGKKVGYLKEGEPYFY